jgi:hypothetical protein
MRALMCSFAAIVVAVAAVAAQDGKKTDAAESVILSGCLGGGPSKFVLTNVTIATTADNKGQKPSGVPTLAASYDLLPRDGVSLAAHVGHRVELTGVIMAAPKPGSAPDAGAKDRTTGRVPPGPSAQFAVTSLKMISPICLQ